MTISITAPITINTTTITTDLNVGILNTVSTAISTVATTYTVTTADSTILLNGASETVTATLPTAVGISGRKYTLKCIDDTFATYVATDGSELLDGSAANLRLYEDESIVVQSNGTSWYII